MADNTPWGPGTRYPWDPAPAPDSTPAPEPDHSARDAAIKQYVDKYGAQIGQPAVVQGTVHVPADAKDAKGDPDLNAGKTITADTGFKTYTFPNGVSVEISDDGQVRNEKLPASATARPTTTAPTTKSVVQYNTDGSSDEFTFRYDPAATGQNGEKGGFVWDKSVPTVHKPADAGKIPPSDPNTWQKIYANPGDPTSKVIGLIDPKTGVKTDVPQGAQSARPELTTIPGLGTYSWDGTTATKLFDAKPDKPQIIPTQGGGVYTWDGTSFQQIGGAREGQTRTSLDPKNPNHTITETFSGGSWVPTSVTGANKPGDTRESIEGGYNVTQTYGDDGWRTTTVHDRATPSPQTAVSSPATAQFITTMDDKGNLTTKPNPNYQPTTMAGIAGQTASLQQQAQAQHDQINGNLQNGMYGSGPDAQTKANAAWSAWWAQNIEPQKAALAQAQQQAQFDQQKQQQDLARANYAQAQSAGQNAVSNFTATLPYRVGPGYNQAFNQVLNATATGKMPGNIDMSQLTYKMPDLGQMAQNATAQALAHISPTAAQMANGQPTPSMFGNPPDINAQLNQTSYSPFGASPVGGGPPPILAAVPPPTDTTGQNFTQQTIPGMNPQAMPGYTPVGGQSTVLPTLAPITNPWGQGTGVNFGTYQYGG